MSGRNGRVSLKRNIVFRFDGLRRAAESCVRIARYVRSGTRLGRRITHVLEQIFGSRKWSSRRFLPVHLELSGSLDRMLFSLADDRNVVALTHHLNEPGYAANGRLVDTDQFGPCNWWLDVTGMNH